MSTATEELAREAEYLALLYDRLEKLRSSVEHRLAEVRLAPRGGTPQFRTERDVLARQLEQQLQSLDIGDLPLCFGRIDLDDGSTLYVGRVGLSGEEEDPLLMDWRAPKAALFYSATSGSPQGVVRRRHLISRGRQLVAIEDEVFDLDIFRGEEVHQLQGDAALLAAVTRSRTGHMRDIVATIQHEQDEVIRSDLAGTLVVQGGPGTGKTAVALHRAAYLLYNHRLRLATSGVLVLGPNPVFLRYIEQVLPSLGETGAVMATASSLFPGVRASGRDNDLAAELKGLPQMTQVIAKAIRDRQRPPHDDAEIVFSRNRVLLPLAVLERARARGLKSRRPHNDARRAVEASILDIALTQIGDERERAGLDRPTRSEQADLRRGLTRSRDFRALMERMWPILSPQELLNDLFGTPALLRSATRGVKEIDPELLARPRAHDPGAQSWSAEDVPLLDDAAEQLGSWTAGEEQQAERRNRARRSREIEYAREVLQGLDLPINIDPERFAERFAEQDWTTVAERAMRDRSWRFGHVIVDEAQELSPVAWQMVFRRSPERSMTVVGDLAQCSATWAPSSWEEVFGPRASGRWRVVELATNYRTPTEIMEVANAILSLAAPEAEPTIAIRSSGFRPQRVEALPGTVVASAAELAGGLLEELGDGRVAVIAPRPLLEGLAAHLSRILGESFDGSNPLGGRAALLGVTEAKGLEFDGVLLVEPAQLLLRGPRGLNDLYVALTRATQRLLVIHGEPLIPELLDGLDLLELPAPVD